MSASLSSDTLTSTRDSRFGCNICLEAVVEPVVTLCGHLYCWPCLYRWLEPGLTSDELQSMGVQIYRPVDASRRTCPVCKAACSLSTVVPIYVRQHQEDYSYHSSNRQTKPNAISVKLQHQQHLQQHLQEDDANHVVSSPSHDSVRRRLRFRPVPNRPSYSPSTLSSLPSNLSRPLPPPPPPAGSLSTGLVLSLQQALFGSNTIGGASSSMMVQQQQQQQQQHYDPATEFLSRVLLMLGSFVILCLLLF